MGSPSRGLGESGALLWSPFVSAARRAAGRSESHLERALEQCKRPVPPTESLVIPTPDLRIINKLAMRSLNTGMIILGGGLIKHHICNANLMRNGADFSLFVNTANEFDGSDSGARPDEAISWGKIWREAKPVKIYGETSMIFPLLVAETFARHHHKLDEKK